MTPRAREGGYTILEVLVSLFLFSVVSIGFTGVMMSGARGTDVTRRNVRLSEEARLGLNRIVRDVREAGWVALPGSAPGGVYTSFTVKTDYDGNGVYGNSAGAATAESNYEVVTYAYDAASKTIAVTAEGFPTETLVKGVEPIPGKAVFSFTSNRLEYDWNSDGVTTLVEVNQNACSQGGNNLSLDSACNSTLSDKELANLSNFALAVEVNSDGADTEYFAEAQLRNRR
ncbi:MAG TPA: prepilin-type N-terminal cleavage/methylation domain-containing protein [Actinomycetota bacterium]|nr:prepilin-type N-terminal cleavage/methylation domain-containing protein [Actinomycetota bacterium]